LARIFTPESHDRPCKDDGLTVSPPHGPTPVERTIAFDRYGPEAGQGPVVISVPHAGRAYPATLLAKLRVQPPVLKRLEDRFADLLVHDAIERGVPTLVATAPRALIDLNRNERELDAAAMRGVPHGQPFTASVKLRGGLGLIPQRLPGVGDLWVGPMEWQDVQHRIATWHRPYHTALDAMMARARERHGHAILIDLHSMPPLPAQGDRAQPRIVVGDLFGRSAASRLSALIADICAGRGIPVAQNHPYAGHYLIERHGRPMRNRHALQIEIDRTLYLDMAQDRLTEGLAAIRALVADIAMALAVELPGEGFALAAE
jgi:N-formylglutamate amidohydrolase